MSNSNNNLFTNIGNVILDSIDFILGVNIFSDDVETSVDENITENSTPKTEEFIANSVNKIENFDISNLAENKSTAEIIESASAGYNTSKQNNSTATEPKENIIDELAAKKNYETSAANTMGDNKAYEKGYDIADNFLDARGSSVAGAINYLSDRVSDRNENRLNNYDNLTNVLTGLSSGIEQLGLENAAEQKEVSKFMNMVGELAQVAADSLTIYEDGVSETSFGRTVEANRQRAAKLRGSKFIYNKKTPLDKTSGGLYGGMVMGTPYLFNQNDDPRNRAIINSLIKDSRYVSFTPGMPKYNGTSYTALPHDKYNLQTLSPNQMLDYLKMNGLSEKFNKADKRYYTFKTDYKTYYLYLETMLNAIWVKLGLANNKENGNEILNLFSFFNNENPINGVKNQYKSSLGFFCNVSNTVSESIDNQTTGFGGELSNIVNENSEDFQRINFITGANGGKKNPYRSIANSITAGKQIVDVIRTNFSGTIDTLSKIPTLFSKNSLLDKIKYVAQGVATMTQEATLFNTTQDLGVLMQSFSVANGMKVMYPELWSNSAYSKNINFTFSFTSPYGDPLSIFKYVYVPFCSLMAMAMPRQAAENGYVSPMFVRVNVPGLITSDLALISSFSFTRGGSQNLWTKDGLPRSIDVSITVTDLYPYLAMNNDIFSLSSNPSYAVFLDSLSGLMVLDDEKAGDALDNYFKELLTLVTGENKNNVWNKFNTYKNKASLEFGSAARAAVSATVNPLSIPWMYNGSQ